MKATSEIIRDIERLPDGESRRAWLEARPPLVTPDLLEGLDKRTDELIRQDLARALVLAETCLAAARIRDSEQQRGDPAAVARALRTLGNVRHGLGRYPEAVEAYEEAREAFLTAGLREEVIRTRIALVDALMYLSRHQEALELVARTREDLAGSEHTVLAARLSWNEGNVYHRMDRYRDALRCYARARRIYGRALDGRGSIAMLDMNRAVVLTAMNEAKRAERLFRRSRARLSALGLDTARTVLTYNRRSAEVSPPLWPSVP